MFEEGIDVPENVFGTLHEELKMEMLKDYAFELEQSILELYSNWTMSTTQVTWEEAFGAYNQLPLGIRMALRHNTASLMEEEGYDEIGSSDVNHRMFSLYKENNNSWQAVVAFYLDYRDHN